MEISKTDFDFNNHGSELKGNSAHGEYQYHNVDVFNNIVIDGEEFLAIYQTGMSFDHNDYDCPSNSLVLSEPGGSSDLLVMVDKLCESDFESNDINDSIEEAQQYCSSIKTKDDLWDLYVFLNDNAPVLEHFIDTDASDKNEEGEQPAEGPR